MKTDRRFFAGCIASVTAALLPCMSLSNMASAIAAPAQPAPVAFNLSSSNPSITATSTLLHGSPSVTIRVGNENQIFHVGSLLTPAEFVAVSQLVSGSQSLILNASGAATGGRFTIASVGAPISSLLIPQGVVAVGQRSAAVSGSLLSAGTLYGLSSTSVFSLTAGSITVPTGGLVSTVVSGARATGLSLTSANNIFNAGAISSSGALNLNAGGAITNDIGGSISAAGSIKLTSGDGLVTNHGTITSIGGNVNFNAPGALTLDNSAGLVSAQLGTISVRDAAFGGSAATTILGGTFQTPEMNIWGGTGHIDMNSDAVTGTVNVSGCSADVATTDSLNLGKLNLTGDPAFASSTDITLTQAVVFHGQNLGIFAQHEILTNGCKLIDLSSTSTNGGNLLMVAGFTVTDNNPPSTPQNPTNINNGTVTIDNPATGGGILLSGVAVKTGSTSAAGNGGSVTIMSKSGVGGSGFLQLGTVDTSSAHASGGSITANADAFESFSAGSSSATVIKTTGAIDGGNVFLDGRTPTVTATVTYTKSSGNFTGTFSHGALSPQSNVGVFGLVDTSGGSSSPGNSAGQFMVNTSGPITTNSIKATGGVAANVVSLSTNSAVQVNGTITTSSTKGSGGTIMIQGQTDINVTGAVDTHGVSGGGQLDVTSVTGHISFGDKINTSESGTSGLPNAGSVGFFAGKSISVLKDINASGAKFGAPVQMTALNGDITIGCPVPTFAAPEPVLGTGGINDSGGASSSGIVITDTNGDIRIGGPLNAKENTAAPFQNGILLDASTGNRITVGGLIDNSNSGTGSVGAITLAAGTGGLDTLFGIQTQGINSKGPGGNLSVTAAKGTVLVKGNIDTSTTVGAISGAINVTSKFKTEIDGTVNFSNTGGSSNACILQTLDGRTIVTGDITGNAHKSGVVAGLLAVIASGGASLGGNVSLVNDIGNGGSFNPTTSDGLFSVAKNVNIAGGNSSTGNGGAGGQFLALGCAAIQIGGSIFAAGGSTSASGFSGGPGGIVVLVTTQDGIAVLPAGPVSVGGTVDAHGGNTSGLAMTGGTGGVVNVGADTVQVKGATASVSINANGGFNGSKVEAGGGTVLIVTDALQPIPTVFDPMNKKASEPAIPGAMFEVGSGKVNGTAGSIQANPNTVGPVGGQPLRIIGAVDVVGNISLNISNGGASENIMEGGASKVITPFVVNGTSFSRRMVTPAEALTLFQVTRTFAPQTITLASDGTINQVLGSSSITIKGFNFNKPLSSLNLQPPLFVNFALNIDLPSANPFATIDLTKATAINIGSNAFVSLTESVASPDSYATFLLGTAPFKVGVGQLPFAGPGIFSSASGTMNVIFSGSKPSIVNNGNMSIAGTTTMIGSQSVNYIGGLNGVLSPGPFLELYSTIGNTLTGTINFQNQPGSGSTIDSAPIIDAFAGAVTFGTASSGNNVITGPVFTGVTQFRHIESLKSITIDTPSTLTFAPLSSIVSNGNISVATGSDMTDLLGGTIGKIQSGGSLSIFSAGAIIIQNAAANTLITGAKNLSFFANTEIEDFLSVGIGFNSFSGSMTMTGVSGGITFTGGDSFGSLKDMTFTSQQQGPGVGITIIGIGAGLNTSGNLIIGSIKNSTFGGNISIGASGFVGKNATFSASGVNSSIAYSSPLSLDVQGGLNMSAGSETIGGSIASSGNISITGNSPVNPLAISAGAVLSSLKNVSLTELNSGGSITVGSDSAITAGKAVAFTPNATISKSQLTSAGTLSMDSAGTISFAASAGPIFGLLRSFGGDINVVARSTVAGTTLQLGSNNRFEAVGGNISLLTASGNISSLNTTGTVGDLYNAIATTSGSAFTGGGVEIQSGTTTSALPALLAGRPAPFAFSVNGQDVGGNGTFTVGNQTKGSITVGSVASGVTLNNNVPNTHALLLLGNDPTAVNSVVIIKANGLSTLTLDSASIESVTPISDVEIGAPEEVVVDAGMDEF